MRAFVGISLGRGVKRRRTFQTISVLGTCQKLAGGLACKNICFSSLFVDGDVSRVSSSSRNVPGGEERGETDVFAGYRGAVEVENRGGSQFFEPLKREGYEKTWQEKKESHQKIGHHDREGILLFILYYVLREYKPHAKIMTNDNFFRENCLILVSLSLLRIVVKKNLLLFRLKPKTFFLPCLPNRKKYLHVRRRSVLIQVFFFESTKLFSLYHCIRSRTYHLFRGGS